MNRKMTRSFSIVLIIVLMLSGVAVGASAEEPQYAYTASFTDVDLTGIDARYLSPAFYTEEGIFVTGSEYVGQNVPEGAVIEYEGQYDVYEQRVIFIGYDGKAKMISYEPLPFGKEPKEGQYQYTSSSYSQSIFPRPDGGFNEIAGFYENWCTKEGLSREDDAFWEYMRYNDEYYFRILDADGREVRRILIPTEEDGYIGSSMSDREGNVFCASGTHLIAFDAGGQLLFDTDTGEYVDNIVCLPDGSVYISIWNGSGQMFHPVRKETGELGKGFRIPGDAYSVSTGGGDYDFYYSSGTGFYGFRLETGEREKLFNWLNLDVASEVYGQLRITDDGAVTGLLDLSGEIDASSDSAQQYKIFTVKRVPASEIGEKITLTLASQWLSYDKRNAVLQFNRSNDSVHIDVLDYSEYNTEDDYSAGLTKLQTEVMAGKMPDLLDLEGLPVSRFAAKGLLEDLYPYLDADEELDREDFFPNVLAAAEQYGRLVFPVPSFTINTLLGAASVVGEEPGWTYAEFDAALARMPSGCRPLSAYTTRGDMLQTCLSLDIENYVNWETGECRFASQDFIDLLHFVNRFPADYDWSLYDYNSDSDMAGLASGRQMLAQTSVFNMEAVMYNGQYFGSQPYTYIGYPTNSGTGNYFVFESGLAMSSKCSDKDAAWTFLRTFFTEKYQRSQFNLPSNRAVFTERLEDAMKVTYRKGTNGEVLLDENGEKIPMAKATISDGLGNTFEIYAMSREDADKLLELVDTTTRALTWDQSIIDVVAGQAEAFFQGQKTAEAVAKLTQSKISLYVNEQR